MNFRVAPVIISIIRCILKLSTTWPPLFLLLSVYTPFGLILFSDIPFGQHSSIRSRDADIQDIFKKKQTQKAITKTKQKTKAKPKPKPRPNNEANATATERSANAAFYTTTGQPATWPERQT